MKSPLKITREAVTILLVVFLLLVPGIGFASYHSIGDLTPPPTPPPPPETPLYIAPIPEPEEPEAPDDIAPIPDPEEPESLGDLAPLPDSEEPEAPGDLAPVPETTEEEDPEAVDEAVEEVLEEEELILEADEPETEAEGITGFSQAYIWVLFLGLLFAIVLIWFLFKRRRKASSNE